MPVPGDSSAPLGRMCRTRTLPLVARRRKRRRSTRGYIPPPLWGEERQFKVSASKFKVQGSARFPVPAVVFHSALYTLHSALSPVPRLPAAPSRGMPRACFRHPVAGSPVAVFRFPVPCSPFPPLHFTLCLCTKSTNRCCKKTTLSAGRHRCEKSNAVSVFGTHQGMYMARAQKRRKKSKTLSSSIKTGLKSVKFGTLFALPILTFHPSNPSGASARAVLTLQKGQKGGAPL